MSESKSSVFWSRVSAVLMLAVIVGGAVAYFVPNEVEIEVPSVCPEPEVPDPVEILVDKENLELVLDHIYDNDGKVNYLLDDLDDDEVREIVDRIAFINEAKILAADYVEAEMADELDKEELGDVVFDEDDIERIRVKSDAEDISVDDIDFEDSDANLLVSVDFEQDDIDYNAVFDVKIKDGLVDDMELVSVDLD